MRKKRKEINIGIIGFLCVILLGITQSITTHITYREIFRSFLCVVGFICIMIVFIYNLFVVHKKSEYFQKHLISCIIAFIGLLVCLFWSIKINYDLWKELLVYYIIDK